MSSPIFLSPRRGKVFFRGFADDEGLSKFQIVRGQFAVQQWGFPVPSTDGIRIWLVFISTRLRCVAVISTVYCNSPVPGVCHRQSRPSRMMPSSTPVAIGRCSESLSSVEGLFLVNTCFNSLILKKLIVIKFISRQP